MQTLLVTGCAGFIGSHTCRKLLDSGRSVVGIDNMNDYYDVSLKEHRLAGLSKYTGFNFRQIDVESAQEIAELFSEYDFDAVINLAARAGVRYSIENPTVYMTTNAIGSLNVLEAMKKAGTRKLVLASTSSLYAGQEMPFVETLAVNTPISPYAASKKSAESIAYTYHHLFGIDVSIVRYFTVYGPADRPDMAIHRFIQWIDRGEPITLYGDGTQARDFTFVDDIADGTIMACDQLKGFEILNLGGGQQPISINDVIGKIEHRLNKKAKIEFKPFNKADMMVTWADIGKAERLLSWKPTTCIDSGLDKCVQWYKDHLPWSSKIRL